MARLRSYPMYCLYLALFMIAGSMISLCEFENSNIDLSLYPEEPIKPIYIIGGSGII